MAIRSQIHYSELRCSRDEVVQTSKSLGEKKEINKVVRKIHPIFIAVVDAPRKLLSFSFIVSEDEIEVCFQVNFGVKYPTGW